MRFAAGRSRCDYSTFAPNFGGIQILRSRGQFCVYLNLFTHPRAVKVTTLLVAFQSDPTQGGCSRAPPETHRFASNRKASRICTSRVASRRCTFLYHNVHLRGFFCCFKLVTDRATIICNFFLRLTYFHFCKQGKHRHPDWRPIAAEPH